MGRFSCICNQRLLPVMFVSSNLDQGEEQNIMLLVFSGSSGFLHQ